MATATHLKCFSIGCPEIIIGRSFKHQSREDQEFDKQRHVVP